jgi:hypothetical protein
VENLAQPIELSVHDPEIRQTAMMLGEKIQDENGVGRAVVLIQANKNIPPGLTREPLCPDLRH